MPQINRIRVNNIKYNFGTQFYDDFLMRFSCKNTIYDLANGGGKSVLMLLLLQTMLPNCTLDEKQPIEKLFAMPGGSTTIHSLVEWKLDSCDVKNGYRYMTCGFCARKAKGSEDAGEDSRTGIEYFNYCIFYREFGDNDIKNLPLSDGKERITYNGLKAYLRGLEKKDMGVRVELFEKKGEYLSFINDYGIYESHWELIRGINKTEGHVRTYFESNYRTTRKVVEDLLIEEIIEKSYNNRIRGGNGDDEMSKTLLEIKDKLLELAKRREEMENYDNELKLISDFSAKVADFGDVFERREEGKNKLFEYLLMARAQVSEKQSEAERIADEIEKLKEASVGEEKLIAAALIAEEEEELKKVRKLVLSLTQSCDTISRNYEDSKDKLELSYAAEDYADYVKQESSLLELSQYIENRNKGRDDLAKELLELAVMKHGHIEDELSKADKALLEAVQKKQENIDALNNLRDNYRVNDNECARIEGTLAELGKQITELENEINAKLENTPLLVVENASSEAAKYAEYLAGLKNDYESLSKEETQLKIRNDDYLRSQAQADASSQVCAGKIQELEQELEKAKKTESELAALGKIYGEKDSKRLIETLRALYDRMVSEREKLRTAKESMKEYVSSIETLKPADSDGAGKMCEYLAGRYDGTIISGAEYLRDKKDSECALLAQKFPYLPYSVLAGDDYDNVCRDRNIMSMDCGVVPIIRLSCVEAVLADDEAADEPQDDGIYMLACRDLSFIYDEVGRQAGIKKANEELEQLDAELSKVDDRLKAVESDYEKVSGYMCMDIRMPSELERILTEQKMTAEELANKSHSFERLSAELKERLEELTHTRADMEADIAENEKVCQTLERIAMLASQLDACNTQIKENEVKKEAAVKACRLSKELFESREKVCSELDIKIKGIEDRVAGIKKTWERYAPYYKETADVQKQENKVPSEQIDARFAAINSLLTDELGDVADKERLMENARAAMEKAERSMLHRGISLEKAKEFAAQGKMAVRSHAQLNELLAEQEKLKTSLRQIQGELDGAATQMNRIEGSSAYARKSYEERFGELVLISVNNYQDYVKQHRAELERLKKELAEANVRQKDNQKALTACMLMQKDLERMVKSVAPDAEEIIKKLEANTQVHGISGELTNSMYEQAGRAFEAVLKEEQKKRTAFIKARDVLAEQLMKLNAYELAQEIKQNVVPPQTKNEAEVLTHGLQGTMDCIALERDRISRGIEDMELIKSNFENRCVQICTNIRSELERLDKLSKITLDDEVIPVLSLQIPYVKEEMYKDRMSVYINETVSLAENFKTEDERLKFIRGRLCWKRLFSVIVTDMDSIRLNLYKRERIKDQSRYLRYEEAVGSTGQSQGIYIQFLVAVINYIASINAGGKEAAVLGKTIFIDNPFGAAKDVYIWEPIFKLLKTNHVQLIVPARGATPAITGRFDVNYVLGQKLIDKKQQTVVVDYHSQVDENELEYERLSFSQESFDFL